MNEFVENYKVLTSQEFMHLVNKELADRKFDGKPFTLEDAIYYNEHLALFVETVVEEFMNV